AGATGQPILLVSQSAVPPETSAAFASLHTTSTEVVGGTASISDAVAAAVPGSTRLAGATRYTTATAVATFFAPSVSPPSLLIGARDNAHRGDSRAAGAIGRMLVLTPAASLDTDTAAFVVGHPDVATYLVLGGTAAVSATTVSQLAAKVPA